MAYNQVKTQEELVRLKVSGSILAQVLRELELTAKPGMSTKHLDDFATKKIMSLGGTPILIGYMGFPAAVCISLNDEVVHGIPSPDRIIEDGDLVSFDLCVEYEGMITDAATTIIVGESKSKAATKLLDDTRQALSVGLSKVKDGAKVGDIGHAVETFLSKKRYGIVRDLVGHGVGHHVHEEPNIPNYGQAHTGAVLKTGMTIAVEPMVTLGSDDVAVEKDGWTIITKDNSLSAHFEHTVVVLDDGFEILTTL